VVPKAIRLLHCLASSRPRTALAAAAGLMLALRWPSDPGLWTLRHLDTGPVGRLSPSALVVIGARHCGAGWRERPFTQPDNPTPDETAGSCTALTFSIGIPANRPSACIRAPCARVHFAHREPSKAALAGGIAIQASGRNNHPSASHIVRSANPDNCQPPVEALTQVTVEAALFFGSFGNESDHATFSPPARVKAMPKP